MDYSKMISELKTLGTYTHRDIHKDDKSYENYRTRMGEIINPFTDRLSVKDKIFVHAMNIEEKIVPRKLAPYCTYVNGYYFGMVYLDKAGNIFESMTDVIKQYGENIILCAGQSNYNSYAEAKYIPEIECIMVGAADSRMHASPIHINDDNTYLGYIHDSGPSYYLIDKDWWVYSMSSAKTEITSAYIRSAETIHGLEEAVQEMAGISVGVVNIGGNNYVPIDSLENLRSFVKYKAKLEYKSGKMQKKIDELIAEKHFEMQPIQNRMPHEFDQLICKTYINRIKDNLSVIRWNYNYHNSCFDGMRVYIEGNDVYACKSNNKGQYIKVALSVLNQKNFTADYASEIVMDDMSGTRLAWYASIINQIPDRHRIALLTVFLTDIKMEQLSKLGFIKAICELMDNDSRNIGTVVRERLGVNKELEDSKNIHKWIGINSYQLNAIVKQCQGNDNMNCLVDYIKDIKLMFNSGDISSLDNEVFDEMLGAYEMIRTNRSWGYINMSQVHSFVSTRLSDETATAFNNNTIRYLPKLIAMIDCNRTLWNYYSDFISMVCSMGIRQKIKLYPSSVDEIKTKHDDVLAVYNLKKNEYQKNAFKARVEAWKKYEYENEDFDFCVISPEEPEDLAVEGLELHHCVKSYIERVGRGETNILFIRKKDEKDKPFFTVELANDRTIAQVHGFANRNANTEPGMEEFLARWARNKRLKVGSINSVRG